MRGKYFRNITFRKAKNCPLNHWLAILFHSSRLDNGLLQENLCCAVVNKCRNVSQEEMAADR